MVPDQDVGRVLVPEPVAVGAGSQGYRLGLDLGGARILLVHDVGQGRDESGREREKLVRVRGGRGRRAHCS